MTIYATFQFENEKAREFEYHQLLEEANRHGHDIGAKLIDVRIING